MNQKCSQIFTNLLGLHVDGIFLFPFIVLKLEKIDPEFPKYYRDISLPIILIGVLNALSNSIKMGDEKTMEWLFLLASSSKNIDTYINELQSVLQKEESVLLVNEEEKKELGLKKFTIYSNVLAYICKPLKIIDIKKIIIFNNK
jgi:hypothetical protein